ncbi:hypothetical protein [Intrasporangium chromatireducens]|nr:hypothetical protein [Intrasporangium chromatireducens]
MTDTTGRASSNHPPVGRRSQAHTPLVRAWIGVALVPVFFFLSFAVQTGIYALTGHDPSAGSVPLAAYLTAALPGLAIVLAPCVAAVVLGRRAVRSGVPAGLLPQVVAALLAVGAVVLTVVNR